MLLSLLIIPIIGTITVFINTVYDNTFSKTLVKKIGLFFSLLNLIISFLIFIFFDFSNNDFQFVQESYKINNFDIYLGLDGLSIYFVLLTTIIMPIALLSN
jgi:NADH:ubiquinone oxidoreductase subunit 4 (subunit M)